MVEIRYLKNIDSNLTENLQQELLTKNIGVIGCGGNGGYILEYLARLGVNSIYFWDGDEYSESNLNRQIGCFINTLGINKAHSMYEYLKEINNEIELYPREWFFGEKNEDILDALKCDILFMAADDSYNIEQTRDFVKLVIEQGVPCIDEFLVGLGGNVTVVTNQDFSAWDFNTEIWINNKNIPETQKLNSQPAYKCALIAAESVNQMVQFFGNNHNCALGYKLNIDIYHHKYDKSDKYGEF